MQLIASNHRLCNRLWATEQASLLRKIFLVLIGSALLALSAKIAIPLHPVPVTMQPLAVLFIGMAYGWRLGGATVLAYLVEGACGLPVFAEFYSGLAVFLDPTAGYLIGFLPAATVSGYLVEKGWGRSVISSALAGLAGLALLYLCGLTWLFALVGFNKAILLGIKPFLLLDMLKVLFVASIVPLFWRAANNK
jgi:biotin transport system substrate-specific component